MNEFTYELRPLISRVARDHVQAQLEQILELIEEEKKLGTAHWQRNAYRRLMEIRIRHMIAELGTAETNVEMGKSDVSDIPF